MASWRYAHGCAWAQLEISRFNSQSGQNKIIRFLLPSSAHFCARSHRRTPPPPRAHTHTHTHTHRARMELLYNYSTSINLHFEYKQQQQQTNRQDRCKFTDAETGRVDEHWGNKSGGSRTWNTFFIVTVYSVWTQRSSCYRTSARFADDAAQTDRQSNMQRAETVNESLVTRRWKETWLIRHWGDFNIDENVDVRPPQATGNASSSRLYLSHRILYLRFFVN